MHLLEKEPDDRYQSANGVIHDLAQLREHGVVDNGRSRGSANGTFRCGCWRRRGSSAATTRWSTLQDAFEDALTGRVSRCAGRRGTGGGQNGVD